MQKMIKATAADLADGTTGVCLSCGETCGGVEPDAREYACPSCGERQVYGLEELLMMGRLEIEE